VQLNSIGLAASGSATLANGGNGIRIIGSSGTLVGSVPGFGNLLRGNTLAGIRVESGSGNNLDYNGILANGGLGIDLGPLGITTNDALDADAGANDLLNFATLSNVVQNGASVSMTVTQSGLPSRQQVPSVYASSACDPSGNGEGETWLGNITLTTNAAGVAAANILLPLPSAAPVPAFTATTFANLPSGETTSEFSPCANNNGVMFANGFETGAAAAGVASDSKVMEGFERSSDSEGRLLLRYHNGGALLQPGRSLTVVADHAVIVEAIDADGLVCELAGAIICEVPALAAGQTATLAVQLGVGATRPTLWVEARGADGTLERRVFPLAPR
jgi:hypothetical protein